MQRPDICLETHSMNPLPTQTPAICVETQSMYTLPIQSPQVVFEGSSQQSFSFENSPLMSMTNLLLAQQPLGFVDLITNNSYRCDNANYDLDPENSNFSEKCDCPFPCPNIMFCKSKTKKLGRMVLLCHSYS
ncbi:OLC1v1016905C2 [Oldenlandia corymbosa var. corymbosa]|nr:OLC1v1016905C2 [Oldenlandia corymbosa var. corymbosa]